MQSRYSIPFLIFTLFALSVDAQEAREKPFNVLFIAIDDLRPELNCYGAEHIQSPSIDRLAATGVRFSNAYVQQAICMASRASVMSGIRPERRGIYTGESVQDLMPDVMTMNKFFASNGYTISTCGKIYHFGEDTKNQFGSDYMSPSEDSKVPEYVSSEALRLEKENSESGKGPAFECGDAGDTAYRDGLNTVNAVNKLAELKAQDKPFFMAVGLTKPHLPFCAPKKYWDMYPEESIKLAELRSRPTNSNPYTLRLGGELHAYAGMPRYFADVDQETELILRRAYYACVSYADAQVGKLLDQLDALELRDDTIIVLWGDHGFKLGDYGGWCKWSNMNLDTQIPLVFSVPDGERGEVCEQLVEALDIYPTLADLCGLEKPSHLEGKSLRAQLSHPTLVSEKEHFVHTVWPDNRWNYEKTVMGYSVKSDRFNYVEWVQLKTGEVLERELYDQMKDPNETINVVEEAEYEEVVQSLSKICLERKEGTDHNHAFKKLK